MRLEDLEFRKVNYIGSADTYYEIVRWNETGTKPFCYTILTWKWESEQPDIQFVGSRPFDTNIDSNVLWKLMRYGQTIIQAEYDLQGEL